jgi:hypothetical protein
MYDSFRGLRVFREFTAQLQAQRADAWLKRDIGRTTRRVVLLCDAEPIGIAIKSLSDFTNCFISFG